MNRNNFKVVKLDGTVYDLSSLGIKCTDFIVDSPETNNYQQTIDGRDGFIDMGTDYKGRTLTAKCTMIAPSLDDYALKRNDVFKLFDSKQPFYIIVDAEPDKQWYVKYNGKYSMSQFRTWGSFTLNFISPYAYAQSVSTTLNPQSQLQMTNLNDYNVPSVIKYSFNTFNFSVWNDGDIDIDPRVHDLTITYSGTSSNLSITNTTTGDIWNYTGSTASNDIIKLDGIRSLKNDISIFSDTNRKLITLFNGWNDFEITGATDVNISFDFRYLYF